MNNVILVKKLRHDNLQCKYVDFHHISNQTSTLDKWIKNIHVYYDKENIVGIQVANEDIILWSVRSTSKKEWDGISEESLFQPATSFVLLEYMIIFCKIQVIINLFLDRYISGTSKLFILTRIKSWVLKVIYKIDGWIDLKSRFRKMLKKKKYYFFCEYLDRW